MENKNLYSTSSNPESILKQTIKFLRGMQYKIDFEKCARLLLLNNFHSQFIYELEKDSKKEDSTDLKMSFKSSKVTLTPIARPSIPKKTPNNAVSNDSSLNPLGDSQTEIQKHNSQTVDQ